ncbi:putative spoU rRNA methylase [Mycobacterium kansasii 662]|uniref:Putative spoU rRNA methylase n=1 Tax=Mycobacterium kansasii 662 TaxID=1299326 RepID=X7XQG8_MYCKA|nr:putative spoU rRNA methylase [Mycobacterium kansasii 662]
MAIENFGHDANIGSGGAYRQRVRGAHRAHRRASALESPVAPWWTDRLSAVASPRQHPPSCWTSRLVPD